MSLAQQMTDEINAKTAAQLAAVEAHLGQIEEAETLAATLRSFGLADARATGFARSGRLSGVITYVMAFHSNAEAITQALADADLRISHFMATPDGGYTDVHLHGLDTYLTIDADVGQQLYANRIRTLTQEPAHA